MVSWFQIWVCVVSVQSCCRWNDFLILNLSVVSVTQPQLLCKIVQSENGTWRNVDWVRSLPFYKLNLRDNHCFTLFLFTSLMHLNKNIIHKIFVPSSLSSIMVKLLLTAQLFIILPIPTSLNYCWFKLLNVHHHTDSRNRLPHKVLPPLLLPRCDIHSSNWVIQSHVFPDKKNIVFHCSNHLQC